MYETVEKMLLNPDKALKMMKHMEESTMTTDEPKRRFSTGEPKHRFKRFSHIFGGKDKLLTPVRKDEVNDEEKQIRYSFSSFFDSKSSLFSKKPPKPGNLYPGEQPLSLERLDSYLDKVQFHPI